MESYLLAFVFTLTSLFDCGLNVPVEVSPVYGYHMKFGVPKASLIRTIEENADNLNVISQRIVGGKVTDISEIPYQIGLVIQITNSLASVCGGSLVSNNKVLTAAHCQNDGQDLAQTFTVVLGSNTLFRGGLRIATNDVTVHPSWNPATANNDVAVLRIADVTFTDTIQPILLPIEHDDYVNVTGLASGFGITADGSSILSSQVLYSVEVKTITNEECRRVYGSAWIRDSVICTSGEGGIGTCGGDSGGPLAVPGSSGKILVGLTSFGDEYCDAGNPSAYTRITSFLPWISSVL